MNNNKKSSFSTLKKFDKNNNKCKLLKNKTDIVIISGAARGADTLGEKYAKERGYEIESHPANWDLYGKSAGYKRNVEMVENADAAIFFWDGESRGTKHSINLSKEKGIPYRIIRYEGNN